MKILYIDPETEYATSRAAWLKINENIDVDVASGLDIGSYEGYDLVVVFLGDRGSEFDMRENIDKSKSTKNPLVGHILFAGLDDRDSLFAVTHGNVAFCKLHELSNITSCEAIIQKATGIGIRSMGSPD